MNCLIWRASAIGLTYLVRWAAERLHPSDARLNWDRYFAAAARARGERTRGGRSLGPPGCGGVRSGRSPGARARVTATEIVDDVPTGVWGDWRAWLHDRYET